MRHYKNISESLHLCVIVSCVAISLLSPVGAMRGIMSFDNSGEDVIALEQQYDVSLPLVGLLYDGWNNFFSDQLYDIDQRLGQRLYHITLSPDHYTARQVADGYFDDEYRLFFRTIKDLRWHIVFRTMHEMNGGWFPWSGDPVAYREARQHVVDLAIEEGVRDQLMFVFSVNHWDMPTSSAVPSQQAPLIQCTPARKKEVGCLTREDYRPGDQYVDLLGVTLYNRGKATSHRQRLSPKQILFDQRWQTFARLQAKHKPIVIDEIATTAVYYAQRHDPALSIASYTHDYYRKNEWLTQLGAMLDTHPEIVATLYFNRDYTNALAHPTIGEADRAVYNPINKKQYHHIRDLFPASMHFGNSYPRSVFAYHRHHRLYRGFAVPAQRVQYIDAVYQAIHQYDNPHEILALLYERLPSEWYETLWYVGRMVN